MSEFFMTTGLPTGAPKQPKNAREAARERWKAEQVARADHFCVTMFLGVGKYDKRLAATLKEARSIRRIMLADHANSNFGRGAMIYAVTAGDQLSIHVE